MQAASVTGHIAQCLVEELHMHAHGVEEDSLGHALVLQVAAHCQIWAIDLQRQAARCNLLVFHGKRLRKRS